MNASTQPPAFNPDDDDWGELTPPGIPPAPAPANNVAPSIDDAPPPAAYVPAIAPPVTPDAAPASAPATPPIDVAAIAKSMGTPALAAGLPSASPAPATSAAGPVAPAAPAQTPQQTDDLKAAQTAEGKARDESNKANADLLAAAKPGIDARQKIADQQVKDQEAAAAQRQQVQQRYDAADAAAQAQIAESQKAIKGFKYRDYYSDGEGGTDWARKIGSSLSVALGAFGAGLTKGPNYALQILNQDMDDAHRHQVDELGKMKDAEVSARTGLQDSQQARQKALADLTLNDAARDKLIAAQLTQAAARQSSAEFAPSLTAAAAKLNLDAATKDAQAKKDLIDLNLKLQDEARKKALDVATTSEKEASARHLDAETAWGPNRRTHGAGGGGGGSGGHADALNDILNGTNPAEVQAKYKLSDKALGQVLTSAGKIGAGHAREAHLEHVDETGIDKRAAEMKKELFGPKGPGTQFERLNGMTSVVSNAIKSGDKTAATAVLEEAGGMLSGGKSTKNTVQLLEELRSTKDALESKWGHFTGDPGASAEFTKRLNGLLSRVKEEKRQEVDQIRARAVDTEMGEHGLAKSGKAKERALGHLAAFNGITNDDGTPRYGGAAPPPSGPPVPAGLPAGSSSAGLTKDGRQAWRLPGGKLVAQ